MKLNRILSLAVSIGLPCALAASANADPRVVLEAAQGGPTILLVTNPAKAEVSPDIAIKQIETWRLAKGKLLTVPMAEMDDAIRATSPAAVVIFDVTAEPNATAKLQVRGLLGQAMLAAVNASPDPRDELPKLVAKEDEKDGDLPAGIAKVVRLTLVKNGNNGGGTFPAGRARSFRLAAREVLADAGMTDGSPATIIKDDGAKIKVALYFATGSTIAGATAFPKDMAKDPGIDCTYVGVPEIKNPDVLRHFDVVLFPGGMSDTQSRALGKEGEQAVRTFIENGGGYVGTCAGSYLASSRDKLAMKLIDADILDPKHWKRGTGNVKIELTDEGRAILGDYKGLIQILYANGPLLSPLKSDGAQPYSILAYFRSDMAKSAPGGFMPNTPAIVSAEFGKGRVLCFSPHPEYVDGLEGFLHRAVRWTAHKPLTSPSAPVSPATP